MLYKTTKILLILQYLSIFRGGEQIMRNTSLHNGNKESGKKKKGFFDMDGVIPDNSAPESADNVARVKNGADGDGEGKRKFLIGAIIFVVSIAVLLVAAAVISGMDFISDNDYNDDGLPENDGNPPIIFEIYDPDWETDIFTLPEYIALSPERLEYSDDDGATVSRVGPSDLEKTGGNKLVFLNKYFDAVKRGDHEALNAMLTEAYIEKNGEYEDFPMQKLFNIKITRKLYNDPQFDNSEYDDYYFVVSYNIYRNDGMFRDDCDDQYYCRTLMRVLINSEGDGKIDLITDYYGS